MLDLNVDLCSQLWQLFALVISLIIAVHFIGWIVIYLHNVVSDVQGWFYCMQGHAEKCVEECSSSLVSHVLMFEVHAAHYLVK